MCLQVAAASGASPAITHLAWNAWSNPKVAHILATCTETGVVKVWDMKKRSLVMELADNQGCDHPTSLIFRDDLLAVTS